VRLVLDRSQWSVDLIADGWPERDRVIFPLFHGFALDQQRAPLPHSPEGLA